MLTSAALQLIALVTMTLDHIAFYFLDGFEPLRAIGRIAMPLFTFMLVEGYFHTSSKVKYFGRILIAAILAELPLWLFHSVFDYKLLINILFGFLLGFILIAMIDRSRLFLVLSPVVILLAQVLGIDYGGGLIILVLGFFLARKLFEKQKIAKMAIQAVSLVAAIAFFLLFSSFTLEWWGLLALIPIWLYNGKKGKRLPRYFMYVYYPAHLMVLFLISLALPH